MSFILDALKKSEAERQRQAGPTLLELRITPPRRRYPLWAGVVGVLLAVNVVVLLAFVLRRPAAPNPANAAGGTVATGSVPAPVPAAPVPPAALPAATVPAIAAAVTAALAAENAARAQPGAANPQAAGAASTAPAATAAPDSDNRADDEAAVPADDVPRHGADYANLPSLSQMSGHIPALQLDLLDYSDRASERYALINMHRVHEGDVLPEGARVLAITRQGVALAYSGQNFMLRPGASAP